MIYRCEACGWYCTEPKVVKYRENLDGENGWQTFCEKRCPYCGSEEIEEIMEENHEDDQIDA